MIDINRMNALHAATTQGPWSRCQANAGTCQCGLVWSSELDAVVAHCGSDPLVGEEIPKITDEQMVANSDWIAESHNAWPAVATELTRLREVASQYKTLRPLIWEDSPYGAWADSAVAKYSVDRGSDAFGRSWFVRNIGPNVKGVDSVADGQRECEEHYAKTVAALFLEAVDGGTEQQRQDDEARDDWLTREQIDKLRGEGMTEAELAVIRERASKDNEDQSLLLAQRDRRTLLAELDSVRADRNRLVDEVTKHAAEINRRRGEMAVAREALADYGVPAVVNGITLTMSQRIKMLADK